MVFYGDTNDDGIVDINDEPVGVSTLDGDVAQYLFTSNDKLYKIAVVTANGQAEEIELTYSQLEAEAGETPDNAIEITESQNVTVTVNGTVYYRYTGDACKLTVTVNGEAVLKTVTLSMDSEPVLEDAEGNTIFVEDTRGDWIYFAISGEGSVELSVTVE